MPGHDAARGADPGLEPLGHHPGPGADGALRDRASGGRRRAPARRRRLDLHDAALREPAVVALADDGDDEVLDADARVERDSRLDGAVVHPPDRVRRRQVDRRLEQSPLGDGDRPVSSPAPFSTAVPAGTGAPKIVSDRRREDRGHARARDPAAFGRLRLVPPDRHVTDRDAGDIRDRVRRACLEPPDPETELAQARSARFRRPARGASTTRAALDSE